MKKSKTLITVTLAMFVAIGVVISPILRVEGMCPMAQLLVQYFLDHGTVFFVQY